MFHNSKLMMKDGNGPFFYLPKVRSAASLWLRTHSVMSTFLCDTWWTCVSIHLISTSFRTPPPLVFFIKKYWYRIKLLLLSLLFSFYNGIVTCKRVVSFLSSHPQYLSWTMASIYGHLNNNTVTVTADKRIKGFDQRFNILGAIQFSSWNDSFFKSTSALLENIPMPFL